METLWPWLTIAALGAMHGLSPANGWMFAAARGMHAGGGAQARRALLPIAIGHAVSVAVVVAAVAQGLLMNRAWVQGAAGALLIGVALYRALRGGGSRAPAHGAFAARIGAHAGDAGIAAWSCLMATAHGAGLMLVPALVPICMSDTPAREITASGSVMLALAAVAVHLATMLLTTGTIAIGVCRGLSLHPRLRSGAVPRHLWTAAQVVTGVALIAFR
ncbi:hypothetical protein [Lysobacter sp. TAB13]|uniref:hypothetical protein n=1 Tax=Lysobacter sp. TAB13 TaxID=3233065 RepID=UPI003F989F45